MSLSCPSWGTSVTLPSSEVTIAPSLSPESTEACETKMGLTRLEGREASFLRKEEREGSRTKTRQKPEQKPVLGCDQGSYRGSCGVLLIRVWGWV